MDKPKKNERAVHQIRFAYCEQCELPLAAGPTLADAPKHFHQKSQTLHVGKVVDVAVEDAQAPGEDPGKYLARLAKKYLK